MNGLIYKIIEHVILVLDQERDEWMDFETPFEDLCGIEVSVLYGPVGVISYTESVEVRA